jgi:hypothetical protein
MNNFVSINNTRENIISFDISIQGISNNDVRVWLNIKAGPMDVSFPCNKMEGEKWECVIPPLPFIQKTAYPCSVTMVADGYYFEPMTGTIDVHGSADIYTNNMQNVTYGPKHEPGARIVTPPTSASTVQVTKPEDNSPFSSITQATLRAAATRDANESNGADKTIIDILNKVATEARKPKEALNASEPEKKKEATLSEALATKILNETSQGADPKESTHVPSKIDVVLGALGIEVPEPKKKKKSRFTLKK